MGYTANVQLHRQQGALSVVVQRLPRVLLRRGARGILGFRHHLRLALLLLVLFLLVLTLLSRRSSDDNWDTLHYVTCVLGVRHLVAKKNTIGLGKTGVNVYPLHRSWSDASECIPLQTNPSPMICVHPVEIDRFISGAIQDGTVWEVETVKLFQELLRAHPTLGVLDIGANIGQYSLLAASMKRHVVAVEPYIKHVRMIHKAAVLNNFLVNFTLVQNAVSDSSRIVSLHFKKDNRGAIRIVESANSRLQRILTPPEENCVPSETSVRTITMNDLVPVLTFKEVLLKIDIEGHEGKAMVRSGLFMEKLHVPFVIMEWVFMRMANDEFRIQSVQELVDYMKKYDYEAFTTKKQPLNMTGMAWAKWPQDIIWKLSSVTFT